MPDKTELPIIKAGKEFRASGAIYTFEKTMGRGQTGTVIKATRRDKYGHSKQAVALKVLRDPTSLTRLLREFQTLTAIRSPACAQVLGWETFEFGPAVVFEWIDGIHLLEAARAGLVEKMCVPFIVSQIQEGLRALQSAGLYHGDLAPSNILIDRSGDVRLVDFASAPESKNEIYGTPAYLAPERWRGASCSIASDLFALGLILKDLETNFGDLPHDLASCRARSFGSIDDSSPFLVSDPAVRAFLQIETNSQTRSTLAKAIGAHLDRRLDLASQTKRVDLRSQAFQFPRVASLGLLAGVAAMISVRADAPSLVERSRSKAQIQISSQRWLKIKVNGKDVGFAPLTISNLLPGIHRMEWESSQSAGQTRIQLKAGEMLRLTDQDLSRLE